MQSARTFLTNQSHVCLRLAADPDSTLREGADRAGITERAARGDVSNPESVGALTQSRAGRRNHFGIRNDFPLRHPLEHHCSVGQVVAMVALDRSI